MSMLLYPDITVTVEAQSHGVRVICQLFKIGYNIFWLQRHICLVMSINIILKGMLMLCKMLTKEHVYVTQCQKTIHLKLAVIFFFNLMIGLIEFYWEAENVLSIIEHIMDDATYIIIGPN